MTSFLFWNTKRKSVSGLLAALADEHDVDIIVLAEPHADRAAVLAALAAKTPGFRFHPSPAFSCVDVYSRYATRAFVPLYDDDTLSIRLLRPKRAEPVLLALVHFWSKAFLSDDDQLVLTARTREAVEKVEAERSTRRTILFGDLNIDAYSDALANSEGIHAVMCRRVAERDTRVVKGAVRRMFFNPMWSLLGDHPAGPPGTYYKDRSGHPTNTFWHTFDQVLFRPTMLREFEFSTLRILSRAGETPLITPEGFPDQAIASDHLPIIFSFSLKGTQS